ncbi:MAG: STAS domain-containing protein [Acidobacteria bacterium]|nr:STAS domain-containing protein [Acidobacteriota bacterium]
MQYHDDPVQRETQIRDYLLKRLDAAAAEAFESHYLACDQCFEELRASELLLTGLGQTKVDRRRLEDVVVFEFSRPVQLTRQSREMRALLQGVLEQKDTKVLIDLSRVSRIDSAGLGLLMSCYSHAVRNRGMLKLLRPSAPVQNLLRLTKIDSVLETYQDESQALSSFR